jgi:hypothetical protein
MRPAFVYQIRELIHRHGDTADVLLFTPSLHLTA